MIPHRYPFLLIDRVVNIEVNRSAVGIKNVTVNEPHFEGHFPAHPGDARRADHRGDGADLGGPRRRDPRPDRPGPARLLHEHRRAPSSASVVAPATRSSCTSRSIRGRGKIWKFRGEARVGDTLCAEAEFAAMILTQEEASAKG